MSSSILFRAIFYGIIIGIASFFHLIFFLLLLHHPHNLHFKHPLYEPTLEQGFSNFWPQEETPIGTQGAHFQSPLCRKIWVQLLWGGSGGWMRRMFRAILSGYVWGGAW